MLPVGDPNALTLAEVKRPMKRILVALAVLVAGSWLVAQDPGADAQDPNQPDGAYEPGRAVGRISVLAGDVSVRRGDSGDVVAATVNGPIMADDRILTGSYSRAEVQLDFANLIRIGPNAEVRFTGMDVRSYQIQVAAGTVTFRVLRQGQAQSEVDTPSVAMHPAQPGIYRVTVRDDGTSEVTVRAGEADIYAANGSERLTAGQTMNARGGGPDTEFQVVQAVPPDSWDRWNEDRDRYLMRSASAQRVSPDITGAEDLDQNGRWVQDPTYGQVWAPTVSPDWAPYQNGRWVWEDYYGWTWVSYDPWGWAPYHYGRWFWGPVGWCWYPGPAYGRYYWSPALVGFFGWGGGGGIGFGFGGVGWVPLAPFEPFHPWWGRGFYGGFRNGGFGNTVVVNNVNIYNTYRNARVNGGVTGVNTADFGRRGQFRPLSQGQIQSAGLVRGAVPVAPDRASLRMTDRAATANVSRARFNSFASHMQAPRANHVSFDQQQRSMQQLSRSPVFSAPGAGNSRASSGGGWRSVGDRPQVNSSGGSGAGAQPPHGWGRFGEPLHGTTNSGVPPAAGGGSSEARSSNGGGWRNFQSRPSEPPMTNFGARGSEPVHISPPIVQQRPSYSSPNYEGSRGNIEPRGGGDSRSYGEPRGGNQPRSYGGGGGGEPRGFGGGARSAPSSGGGAHSGGGGGNHGGGGGHGGGGHR